MEKYELTQGSEIVIGRKERDLRTDFICKTSRDYPYTDNIFGRYFKLFNLLHYSPIKNKHGNMITTAELYKLGQDCGLPKNAMRDKIIPDLVSMEFLRREKQGVYTIDFLSTNYGVETSKSNKAIEKAYGDNLKAIKSGDFYQQNITQININVSKEFEQDLTTFIAQRYSK